MIQEKKDILLRLLQRHKELGISGQIDFDKFYLYSIIVHSTAIEGSTVTEVEAQLLFDEGITSNKRTLMEQQMNLDLKVAYEYGREWIMKHKPITVDWLITLASKVMARTGSEYHSLGGDFNTAKGELRKLNVTDKAEYIQALIDTRESEDINVFLNCMATLHCRHLQTDIDQYMKSMSWKMVDKSDLKQEMVDKWSIKPSLAEKLADILGFVADKDETTTESIVSHFGFPATSAKRYLRQLVEFGYLEARGGNKNRTYIRR